MGVTQATGSFIFFRDNSVNTVNFIFPSQLPQLLVTRAHLQIEPLS